MDDLFCVQDEKNDFGGIFHFPIQISDQELINGFNHIRLGITSASWMIKHRC